MTKTVCDYCGSVIPPNELKNFTGDLDAGNLAIVRIEPVLLNQTNSKIDNPDLCRKCIIKVLRG